MINCINDHQLTATVVRIEWERIIVSIDIKLSFAPGVDKTEPLQFYAVNGLFCAKALFEAEQISDDHYRLSMNLTNPGDVRCLPWREHFGNCRCGSGIHCKLGRPIP